MGHVLSTEGLIIVSNIALVVVTGGAIWVTLRESNRHEERDKEIAALHEAAVALQHAGEHDHTNHNTSD
jgi:hypothetical protein